jgi:hypothetical protein
MRRAQSSSLVIATFVLLAGGASGQRPPTAVLDGVVSDSGMRPVTGANVTILGTEVGVVTGENGRFRITNLAGGEYTILTRRIGFEATVSRVQLANAETLKVSVSLEPIATRLAAMAVTARLTSQRIAEFLARRERLDGQFMTQAEIEQVNAVDAGSLLSRFKYLTVIHAGLGQFSVASGRGCMEILVDGFPTSPNDVPSPKAIAGIEVYLGPATAPIEYKRIGTPSTRFCGLILMWTRDGS